MKEGPDSGGPPLGSERKQLLRWTGWFVVGNTVWMLLAAVRAWQSAGWPSTWPARFFLLAAFVGQYFSIALALNIPAAVAAMVRPSRWVVGIIAVVLSTLGSLVVLVDSIVFHLFRFHLNGMVWSLIREGHLSQELPLSPQTWLMAVVLVGVVLGAEVGLALAVWRWVRRPRLGGVVVGAVLVLAVLATHLGHAWADAAHYTAITRIPRNLPACRPLTAKRLLRKLGLATVLPETAVRFPTANSMLRYPVEPLSAQPPAQLMNLVLVVIDGWRFDMLNEATTPNLYAFSRGNLRFDRHSSAANATRFGIFTLFYGLYGTYWAPMLAEERGPVLITELKKHRYQFGVWGAAPLSSPEFDRTVFADLRPQLTISVGGGSAPERDKEITRRLLKFLDDRDRQRPFLGFVFYDSTHAYDYPPDAPAPFQPVCAHVQHLTLSARDDPVPIRNRYKNAVHFVDSLVAQILQRLAQEELLDSTIVVITADHGQEFNDTGQNYWGHNSNWTRYQTGVPLVVHWPGKGAQAFGHQTTHLDLAPTLLKEMLNYTNAPRTFSHGTSLFDTAPRTPLVIGNWNRFGLITPGRIDVFLGTGQVDHYDEDWREITTPAPTDAIRTAMEGMSRFLTH